MNEFEWLRQTRSLASPSTPQRDLWPDIAAHLAAAPGRREAHPAWSIAAAVLLACGGLLGLHTGLQHGADSAPGARNWQPADPRLVAAAVDLDAAHAEITQALQLDPHGQYLHRLLQRTERQRNHLQTLDQTAG